MSRASISWYIEPAAKGYVSKLEFSAPNTVSPQAFPDLKVAVGEILV
jgi:hypothetical protein